METKGPPRLSQPYRRKGSGVEERLVSFSILKKNLGPLGRLALFRRGELRQCSEHLKDFMWKIACEMAPMVPAPFVFMFLCNPFPLRVGRANRI